jgi:FkbM family methyltransferase
MDTKKFDEWTLPVQEQHLPQWMSANNDRRDGRLTYQAHKYDAAFKRVTEHTRAIDVGGHMGMWSWLMAKDFTDVVAFEPVALHRKCFKKNLAGCKNVTLLPYALGQVEGMVGMKTHTADSTGDTGVDEDGDFIPDEYVKIIPLDTLQFTKVGLIKIDCEGFEANVVKGAAETITRNRPIIIVEQKGNMSERYGIPPLEAVTFLESLGMKKRDIISGDFIMDWPA